MLYRNIHQLRYDVIILAHSIGLKKIDHDTPSMYIQIKRIIRDLKIISVEGKISGIEKILSEIEKKDTEVTGDELAAMVKKLKFPPEPVAD